jgi:hypothetical protein
LVGKSLATDTAVFTKLVLQAGASAHSISGMTVKGNVAIGQSGAAASAPIVLQLSSAAFVPSSLTVLQPAVIECLLNPCSIDLAHVTVAAGGSLAIRNAAASGATGLLTIAGGTNTLAANVTISMNGAYLLPCRSR